MVISVTVTRKFVVGCRTGRHQVLSVERTAITTNNKGLYKMMSFSAEPPTQKHLVLSVEQTALATMGLSSKQTAVTK